MPPSWEAQQSHNWAHAELVWLWGNAFARACIGDVSTSPLGSHRRSWYQVLCSSWRLGVWSVLSPQPPTAWHCWAPESFTCIVHGYCCCMEVESVPARSHLFFLCELCAGEITPWLSPLSESLPELGEGRTIRGMNPRCCSCCISKQPFLYSLKTLQEPGYEKKMHLEKGSTAG